MGGACGVFEFWTFRLKYKTEGHDRYPCKKSIFNHVFQRYFIWTCLGAFVSVKSCFADETRKKHVRKFGFNVNTVWIH